VGQSGKNRKESGNLEHGQIAQRRPRFPVGGS
jgi:hypothetical protein